MNLNLLPNGQTFRGGFYVDPVLWGGEFDLATQWVPAVAAAKAVGMNFIAYFGDVREGHANLTTYLAKRALVANYLASQEMFGLSYSLGFTMDQWIGSVTFPQALTVLAADAAQQATFPNMIGDVIVDEAWASYTGYGGTMSTATIVAFLADAYALEKTVVPSYFPVCATPNPCGQIGLPFTYTGDNKALCDSVAPYCDFLAFHPFYPMANADFSAVSAAFPTKDLIFPSSVSMGVGDPDLLATIDAVMGAVGVGKVRGMGYFSLADWTLANNYGMYSSTFVPRVEKTVPFAANVPVSPDIYGAFMAPSQLSSVRYASFKARGYAP